MGAIKVVRGILAAVWFCLLTLSLWLAVQRQAFCQEPSLLGWTVFPVREAAMGPALSPGDVAAARAQESYQLGDAVLWGAPGEARAGRLVGSTGDQYIVRGDGELPEAEALLSPEGIRGRVEFSLPGAGGLYDFLSAPWGPPAVLAAGALLLGLPRFLGLGRPARPQGAHYRDGGNR